ncbi:MAG: hypothetical protein ACK42I_03810 [Thermomicrobium sp.]
MPSLGEPLGALLLAIVTTTVLLALGAVVIVHGLRGGSQPAHPWLLRGIWVGIVTLLVIGLNLLSETWTRAEPAGTTPASLVAQVEASMWRFALEPATLPVGQPIEFRVRSADTIHGFGVYDPTGKLLFTVMAVPGTEERAIFTFREPGTYTVRCTEYCGAPHGLMRATFTVQGR